MKTSNEPFPEDSESHFRGYKKAQETEDFEPETIPEGPLYIGEADEWALVGRSHDGSEEIEIPLEDVHSELSDHRKEDSSRLEDSPRLEQPEYIHRIINRPTPTILKYRGDLHSGSEFPLRQDTRGTMAAIHHGDRKRSFKRFSALTALTSVALIIAFLGLYAQNVLGLATTAVFVTILGIFALALTKLWYDLSH